MRTFLRAFGLSAGLLTLSATAFADAPVVPAATAATPAATEVGTATREELLEQLKKANTQLADDKKAAAEAKKGTDKAAAKAAQDKVKADGKAIHELDMKLHALKGPKKPVAKKG